MNLLAGIALAVAFILFIFICILYSTVKEETQKAKELLKQAKAIASACRIPLNMYSLECHMANYNWWHDEHGNKLNRNRGELIALMHSELSEALEGERKDCMDTHLTHRKMAEVELADTLIRIFDYAAAFGYDLENAYQEKMAYNARRADHTHAARKAEGGKKF